MIYKPTIIDALESLGFPSVAGAVINTEEGYKGLKIYSEKPLPAWSEVSKKLEELVADFDAKKYQRDRLQEYPDTNDLIVALWEKVVEGRSESADALELKRQEVKNANPKPE